MMKSVTLVVRALKKSKLNLLILDSDSKNDK